MHEVSSQVEDVCSRTQLKSKIVIEEDDVP